MFRMALFGRRSAPDDADAEVDARSSRARLERKLCIARESPEPSFDLAGCALAKVPHGVFSLCRVFRKESLNLENNRLASLEDGGDLKDLDMIGALSLSNNKFRKLPDGIRRLVALRELYLDNNKLKTLPDEIGDLASLRILSLANNLLESLPESLGKLQNLKSLSVIGNERLRALPNGLCGAGRLTAIELDASNYEYPPREVAEAGTTEILKFLCDKSGVEYVPPDLVDGGSPRATLLPAEYSGNLKSPLADWERQEEHLQRLECEIHEASKKQREKFLEDYTTEREKLDREFGKIQQEKDLDRSKLVKQIMEDEKSSEQIVSKLLQINMSNPLHIQQLLEHDQKEHDRLTEMCRINYIDLKKTDTLKAMESLLQEECEYEKSLKIYGQTQSEVKQSFLLEELNASCQLDALLKTRDEQQSGFIEKLLNDENVQKAAVAALLERCDARTWGLTQEISLVESQLAKLSSIELDRRKLQLDENVDNIGKQRLQLSVLLVDLLDQQEMRRSQLVDTLKAMELEKNNSDFWLMRYQQLLDTVPSEVISSQQRLDPIFANYLLQEGVIHCLPFLIKKLFSKEELSSLNDEVLQQLGVRLSSDRSGVIKAVKLYLEELLSYKNKMPDSPHRLPSAPPESPTENVAPSAPAMNSNMEQLATECVVCMENNCEVVFIPCGHLSCCLKCSDEIGNSCPMCRQNIERKIRVIQT